LTDGEARRDGATRSTNVAGTIIGNGLTIEGEITSDEEVIVAGTVRGKLTVEGPLTIDAGALIEADIGAASLQVGGNVTGNVTAADRVDLLAGGRLVGDVKASRLTIADGASFKGNVDMDV
jgi:cytoskeletal protein CcmA (bactofilin family)